MNRPRTLQWSYVPLLVVISLLDTAVHAALDVQLIDISSVDGHSRAERDFLTSPIRNESSAWKYSGTQLPTLNASSIQPTPPAAILDPVRDGPSKSKELRWETVPEFVRHLYQSIADDRGFVRNANSKLVQNSTAVLTFTNKVKGRGRHNHKRLSFTTHPLFQPKKPSHALPKIERALLRLYRRPQEQLMPRAQRRQGGADRLRVTINYHTSRSSPPIPIRRAMTSLNKHGWETLDLTDLLVLLQNNGVRRRRLSLSIDTEIVAVPFRKHGNSTASPPQQGEQRQYKADELFTLRSDSLSTVPLLTVYLLNRTGSIEDLMPHLASKRRQRRDSQASLLHANALQPIYNGYCRLQDMVVNFAIHLQWKEILTPKYIHANDCVGTCEIPIGRVQNNAVLRHWYWQYPDRAQGRSPLSCIPTRFAKVTMLSLIDGNYELLPFPDMVAVECGCA